MSLKDTSPRALYEEREHKFLQELATRSTDPKYIHRVHHLEDDPFRTGFLRDHTRLIHSRAFRRLRHKTQVFISPKNDHLCTRMEHSLYVASVATTIARALCLNEDLVLAIAVGHDIGHSPFGHKGEKCLDEIAKKHDLHFCHELQSLRVVDYLESPYKEYHGLNLTFAVRDGIACHYGERFENELAPDRDKPFDALNSMRRGEASPATLEGCVVRWADKIAYLGRDLADALMLHVVNSEDIPPVVRDRLGTTNREIISSLVHELVANGTEGDRLRVSPKIHEALNVFYEFNCQQIYKTKEATWHFDQIDRAMRTMFDFLLRELEPVHGKDDVHRLEERPHPSLRVLAEFLREDVRSWTPESRPQLVIDFIAGMTDSYFIRTFRELFVPNSAV